MKWSPSRQQQLRSVTKAAASLGNILIFGEVFNAFNIANLRGYGSTLDIRNPNPSAQTYAFGQPTQRALQTFGSAGPRAFQVGARVSF